MSDEEEQYNVIYLDVLDIHAIYTVAAVHLSLLYNDRLPSGLSHHYGNPIRRSNFDSGNSNHHCISPVHIQNHCAYQTISHTVSYACKTSAHVDSVHLISNIYGSIIQQKEEAYHHLLDNGIPPIQRISNGTEASPTASTCDTSMLGTRSINNINTNYDITSKQAYSCGRSPPTCGYAINPVAGSNIMHEKVPSRKIGTITPYMSTTVHSNLTKKGSYYTQIYKNGLSSVNDHTEQKVNSCDESGIRSKSNDFKLLHAENNSKRCATSEQTSANILQSGFMDITNRGYAAKSVTTSFSMKPADVRQNSLPSFFSDEYGTMRVQASHARHAENFNYELSTAGISRKISNEHSRSSHRDSQEEAISGQEYMKRLLQAHHVVDELLRSRGLIPEDEIDYLRNWRQKMGRELKIEERNVVNVSNLAISKNTGNLDTSEASQQRCTSNASDSGLSMDADSDNDPRDSPKLRGLNSQKFMVTDLLPTQKQETHSVKSVKVNIVKANKHKNVHLKVIIRKPQQCWLHMDAKIILDKKKAVNKKMTNSSATRNSKKSCSKKRQTVGGQTEQVESKNLTHIPAKSNKKGLVQSKRLNQDCKMKVKVTPEPVTLTSTRESGTAKSNEPQANKNHNVFIPKLKCETISVCFCFVNKLYHCDKTTISLSIARFATVKKKSFVICDKKFLEKTEGEQKLKCNKNNSVHVLLLAKTRKLPFNQKYSPMFPELQSMGKTSKIKVASREFEVLESKNNMIEIKKDLPGLKKVKKCFKFPISIEESAKKLKTPEESASSLSVPHMKKMTPNQARKISTSKKQQLCTVTVSKKLCQRPKSSQLETTMTVPVRSSKIKITQSVMIKKMMNNKEHQHKELLRVPILKKKESIELKKVQKVLQNYATVIPKYYQKTLRPTTRNESKAMTEFERNAGVDIRQVREHLRRINFNRTDVRLGSNTSFVHRINESPVKLSNTNVKSLETSSEQASSTVKKKVRRKASGKKMDKDSKDRPAERATSTEERCRDIGTTAERKKDILDRELVNEYRRTQLIPKPQAEIPAWNVHDERKQVTVTVWNPPKLRHETLSTASPVPHFIRARTPTPINVAGTSSTLLPITSLLRYVPANPPLVVTSRPKNVLSGGNDAEIAGNVHQQSPGNQFGVMLKRVDRAALQKNKSRGAITQSAPKKPWVPKWRRIQRTEEEEEAETIPIEVNKNKNESGSDEQEEKQTPIRLSSQVVIEKDEKNMTEAEKAMMVAKRRQIEEETTKLQEYEEKRRVEREREEEELRKLKEKKERRKLEREEEERQFQERLRQEEERRKQEEDERRAKMEAEKRKKEDEKRKRQQMLLSQFTNTTPGQTGRNFIIPQKSDKTDKFGNIVQAKQEMGMTKEQQEEAKRNHLVSVKHTIEFENVTPAKLREKIHQLHQRICKLEADKYDLEKRHERQEYDLRELNERQRQVARNKALKKGLGPTDASSRHPNSNNDLSNYILQKCVTSSSKDGTLVVRSIPIAAKPKITANPKVSIVSKYDRQIDRRNFKERRAMFENKNAYPCFPNVPPPPAIYDKVILSDDKGDKPKNENNEIGEQTSVQIVMVRSCTGQNSKTTNNWKVDQCHRANLTINLHSKSIKNLTNNDEQLRPSPSKEFKFDIYDVIAGSAENIYNLSYQRALKGTLFRLPLNY
uniref:Uncharacterized protein n=1 Tax=Onchocerca volvulus TaxID=6282 RepID=A0A8R1TUL9_ONCVO